MNQEQVFTSRAAATIGLIVCVVTVGCAGMIAFTIWTIANGWEFMR